MAKPVLCFTELSVLRLGVYDITINVDLRSQLLLSLTLRWEQTTKTGLSHGRSTWPQEKGMETRASWRGATGGVWWHCWYRVWMVASCHPHGATRVTYRILTCPKPEGRLSCQAARWTEFQLNSSEEEGTHGYGTWASWHRGLTAAGLLHRGWVPSPALLLALKFSLCFPINFLSNLSCYFTA